MATCLHCRQGKGKRACPALHGNICSQCCGAHRLKEIACPSDCVWLGGLAALRDPATVGPPTKEAYESAMDHLVRYARDHAATLLRDVGAGPIVIHSAPVWRSTSA